VEAHLRGCAACAELAARHTSLTRELRQVIPLTAPAELRERAQAIARGSPSHGRLRVAILGVAAMAAGVAAGWLLARENYLSAPRELFVHDVVAAHVRSLLPGHLTDVLSSDQHTVKPWFAGRLDYSPWVADLTAEGFPLVGGRVDYIGGRRVAVLVYQRRQHFIDLVVSPIGPGGAPLAATTGEGYHLLSWTMKGQALTAISDVSAADLAALAEAVRGSEPAREGR
jgi:anti-sigma factor RsiW